MKNNRGKILVDGSVGFDMVFSVKNTIKENINIKDGVLLKQNLMFTANSKREFFGGTGGNISYGLGLLGAKPILFSSVGKDFLNNYKSHLEKVGVELKTEISKEDYTATFYGITDSIGEQVGIWQPNSYLKIETFDLSEKISKDEFKKISIAIFSAGTSVSILKHMREFRKYSDKDALVIFDPGQVVNHFNKNDLLECIDLCDLFIANKTEFMLTEKTIEEDIKKYIIKKGKKYIETKGSDGSEVYWNAKTFAVPIIRPKKVVETTGAGDAYRAGLIFGLWSGMKIEDACDLAAKVSSKKVEYPAGQEYHLED